MFKLILKSALIILSYLTLSLVSFASNKQLPAFPNEPGPKTFDQSTIKEFREGYKNVVLHGFNGNEKFQSSRLQRSYFMAKPEAFFGKFLIANYTEESKKFKLYFFVDYQQQSYKLYNKESIVHSVTIKSNSELILPMRLRKITDGAHDILVLAVNENKKAAHQFNILSHRANVYVSKGKFKNIKYNKLTQGIKNSTSTEITINSSKRINNSDPIVNFKIVKDNQYYLHVSNHYKSNMRYSLIVLLNSKQIPTNSSSKIEPFYFKQNKFTKNVIPIKLKVKSTKKELLAIVIDNPYVVLEPERSIFSDVKARVRISNKIH